MKILPVLSWIISVGSFITYFLNNFRNYLRFRTQKHSQLTHATMTANIIIIITSIYSA